MVRRLSWIAISLAADWMALIPLASDRRLSWIAISLAVPFFAGAATPDVHKLSPLPLRFETAADGSLVAREGPYRLSVEAGRTTVADRAHRRLASVTARWAGANADSRPVGGDGLKPAAD